VAAQLQVSHYIPDIIQTVVTDLADSFMASNNCRPMAERSKRHYAGFEINAKNVFGAGSLDVLNAQLSWL